MPLGSAASCPNVPGKGGGASGLPAGCSVWFILCIAAGGVPSVAFGTSYLRTGVAVLALAEPELCWINPHELLVASSSVFWPSDVGQTHSPLTLRYPVAGIAQTEARCNVGMPVSVPVTEPGAQALSLDGDSDVACLHYIKISSQRGICLPPACFPDF